MKKRIMLSIGVLAIAVVVSLNINLAKTDSSSLAFMNIQALAGETGGGEPGGGESGENSGGCKTELKVVAIYNINGVLVGFSGTYHCKDGTEAGCQSGYAYWDQHNQDIVSEVVFRGC